MKIKICLLVGTFAYIFLGSAVEILFAKQPKKGRERTLVALLEKSQQKCNWLNKSLFQGLDPEGNAYWNVTCDNQQTFNIMIENNSRGSTRVLGCDVLKLVNTPCWVTPQI